MLSKEENERLTQFGPGTPCGELLRRYWHPVAVITELSEETPTKFVRVLGEDLVLFSDQRGNVGLIQDHCAHRGASMLYGRVEERGIACAYHGWLYDADGNCLETPAEPAGSMFHLTVRMKAYAVQPHLGLYWAYLGPTPAPLLPTCGLAPEWPVIAIEEQVEIHANWLQVMENFVDGLHFPILHQEWGGGRWPSAQPNGTTRGYIDQYLASDYWEEPWGIMHKAKHGDGAEQDMNVGEDDALLFPNIRRHHSDLPIMVPVDDTETKKYVIYVTSNAEAAAGRPVEHWVRQFHLQVRQTSDGRHRMDQIAFQDLAVMESQGVVAERENWRMATSDRGVMLLHRYLLREIARVQQGLDPLGVVREPADMTAAPLLWQPSGRFRLDSQSGTSVRRGIKLHPRDPVSAAQG
jgi:5,5'-dehydrodivanillate O-demethylase oxygenase subunit